MMEQKHRVSIWAKDAGQVQKVEEYLKYMDASANFVQKKTYEIMTMLTEAQIAVFEANFKVTRH
jgi:hypothetical protein